ncbi:MAG: PQQ-binding-like beta-propeller repeat protein [Verrucomicrobiota bacterium]
MNTVFRVFASIFVSTFLLQNPAAAEPEIREIHQDDLIWAKRFSYLGSLAVADGKVFVGANNYEGKVYKSEDLKLSAMPEVEAFKRGNSLVCLDLETGDLLWRSAHPMIQRPYGFPGYPLNSTPAIDGDRVFFLTVNWEFVCADTEGFRDGENDGAFQSETSTGATDVDIIWKVDLIRDLKVEPRMAGDIGYLQSSPLLLGDLVYLVSGNGTGRGYGEKTPRKPEAPSFLAIDRHIGEVRWSSSAPGEDIFWMQGGSPAAAGADSVLFPGGNGSLYRFAAHSGELLDKFDYNQLGETPGYFFSSRLTVSDQTVLAISGLSIEERKTGPLLAFDLKNRKLKWRFKPQEPGAVRGVPAITPDGHLVVNIDPGYLAAFDVETGQQTWKTRLSPSTRATYWEQPLILDETVVTTNEDGELFQVSTKTGEVLKVLEFPDTFAEHASPIRVQGGLLLQTRRTTWRIRLEHSK